MRKVTATCWLATVLALVSTDSPAAAPAEPVWTREAARTVLARVDTDRVVARLVDLTVTGAETDIIELLEDTRRRNDWPAPARDAAVFAYTLELRALPPRAASRNVMAYLRAYAPGAHVAHDDHPQGTVPLFNVPAAATGVVNGWRRQEALLEGLALVKSNPRALADAFALETAAPVRAGYLQALDQATPEHATGVVREALPRLADDPGMTPLAARAATRAADLSAILVVLDYGRGPALQHMLTEAAAALDKHERTRLLSEALASPHQTAAALALASLYPGLAGTADADAALLARLGDPELGAAAALGLSRSPSLDTRLALEALAATDDRPAARRARLALDLAVELADERTGVATP